MKPQDFPAFIRSLLIPAPGGELVYRCIDCGRQYGIGELLYTCPYCHSVLLIDDLAFERLKAVPGARWRQIFDYRKMLTIPALRGIYRYHEFIGPTIPLDAVLYLGEGHTPMVEANANLQARAGLRFYFKNDGQNPSASFKDRGMASALSYIHYLLNSGKLRHVLAVCASTGDTSAAAALYAAYLQPVVKSAVLLPQGKVTPQQLSQPLGSGATVFEIPGVFDHCMKVVEALSESYPVALLNSKNAWRILGQESYAYEIAQDFEYDLTGKVVVVPVGNAGNITAVMNGFMKFYRAGVVDELPKIVGVQSAHADPVYRYYAQSPPEKRKFVPLSVQPSVAQAAMIGNPVSMPRVIHLTAAYNRLAGCERVFFVQVSEQQIMDWQLTANRNGHIACTHGGESLAGLVAARKRRLVAADETAVVDSTAHALKFSGFQQMYFGDSFPPEFEVVPRPDLTNSPIRVASPVAGKLPDTGNPDDHEALALFVRRVAGRIAEALGLKNESASGRTQ